MGVRSGINFYVFTLTHGFGFDSLRSNETHQFFLHFHAHPPIYRLSKEVDEDAAVGASELAGEDPPQKGSSPLAAELKGILDAALAARDGDLRQDMKAVKHGILRLSETAAGQKAEIRNATAVVAKLEEKLADAQYQLDRLRSGFH
jgi:ABC-type transporter Mla subunit MlaD